MKTYYLCRCSAFDQTLDRVSDEAISYYTGWNTRDDGTCYPGWSYSIDDAIGFASIRDASSLLCYVCDKVLNFYYFVDEREEA